MVDASFPETSDDDSGGSKVQWGDEIWFDDNNKAWFRFPNVTIPRGSTITDAYIGYYCNGYSEDGAFKTFHMYFEDADNATQIASVSDFDTRTKTTATVNRTARWGYSLKNWTDLESLVQEVVDRSGWISGNAMQCLCVGYAGGSGTYVSVRAYEGGGIPPTLYVSYIPPSGGQVRFIGMMM